MGGWFIRVVVRPMGRWMLVLYLTKMPSRSKRSRSFIPIGWEINKQIGCVLFQIEYKETREVEEEGMDNEHEGEMQGLW